MEDPEAKKVDEVVETEETVVAELFIETPEAEKLKKPSSNRLSRLGRSKKIEEPGIELFVEAILEAAEEADEVVIEETVVESIIEAILKAAESRGYT